MLLASQKLRPFTARKNQLGPGQEIMEDAAMLSRFSLLRNPWLEPTGVLEHCRHGGTNSWFSILRAIAF